MQKVILIIISIFFFISCEKEADAIDFLTEEQRDELFGIVEEEDPTIVTEEEGEVVLGQLLGEDFKYITATAQLMGTAPSILELTFTDKNENIIKVSIPNPATGTYTVGAPSSSFIGEVILPSENENYTTNSISESNTGILKLEYVIGDSKVTLVEFEFKAFIDPKPGQLPNKLIEVTNASSFDLELN